MLPGGARAPFDALAERTRFVSGVSTSPTEKGIGPATVSSNIVWFGIAPMLGLSFTASTVTMKLRLTMLLEEAPSLTETVMVAAPLMSVSGAKLTVPLALGLV